MGPDPWERTLRSKGNGGSHEHGSGILAISNGGSSCSVGRGASLRSNFYPYAAQEPRQKSLVIAAEKPRHAERETGLVITSILPSKAGLIYGGDRPRWRSATLCLFDLAIGDQLRSSATAKPCPSPFGGGRIVLWGGVMAPPLALIDATTATSGRSARCRALDTRKHSTHHATSVTNVLNTLPELCR